MLLSPCGEVEAWGAQWEMLGMASPCPPGASRARAASAGVTVRGLCDALGACSASEQQHLALLIQKKLWFQCDSALVMISNLVADTVTQSVFVFVLFFFLSCFSFCCKVGKIVAMRQT